MVFGWPGHDLTGWRCTDVFTNIGALGFETASHGAVHVILVENHARVVHALHTVHNRLGAHVIGIISGGAFA